MAKTSINSITGGFAHTYDIDAALFSFSSKLGDLARPEKITRPMRDQSPSHSKIDICIYNDTAQFPPGSSNNRIRSWIAALSRSILIRSD